MARTADVLIEMLPRDWAEYPPMEKIKWFNANNVTPTELMSVGVPQSDISFMFSNGYTGGTGGGMMSPAPAPVAPPPSADNPPSPNDDVVTATDPNAQPATKAEAAGIPARYTNIEVVKAPVADADQSQEPDKYFATDSETGDRVELLKASEYPVGNGPSGTEWLARRAGDMITTPDGRFLPFEAVDSKGNIIGTWNMQKNELSDFANVVGGATKVAAVLGTGYALGSAAGLFGGGAAPAGGVTGGTGLTIGTGGQTGLTAGVGGAAGSVGGAAGGTGLLTSNAAVNALTGATTAAAGAGGALSTSALADLFPTLSADLSNLSASFGNIGTGVTSGLGNLGTGLGTGLSGIGAGIGELGTGLTAGVTNLGTQLGQGIGTGLSGLGTGLGEFGSGLFSGIGELGAGLGTGLSGIGSGIGQGISGLTGAVGSTLGGLGGTVGNVLGGLGGAVTNVLGGLTQASTASSLSNLFSNLVNAGIDADTARRLADQQLQLGDRLNAAAQAVAAGQQVPPETVAELRALAAQSQNDLRTAASNAQLPPSRINELLTAANTAQQQIVSAAEQARLTPEQLQSYQNLAQTTAGQFAQAGEQAASQFTPYTVTTGAGTARVAPGQATVSAAGPYAALQQQALQGAGTAFGQVGAGDYAQTLYNQARALQAPTEARQQEQLLSSLGARGLLGIGRNLPTTGGTTAAVNPYVESLLSAQRTADAQLALQAQQAGTSEALRQAQLGQGLLSSAQGIDTQAQQLLGQAAGLGAQQTAIQQANNQARLQATLQGLGLPLQAQQQILALQQTDAGRQLQAQLAAAQLPLGATQAGLNLQQQGMLATLPTYATAAQLPLGTATNIAQLQQAAQGRGLQAQTAGLGYQALAGLNAADIQAGRTSGISQGIKSAIPGLFAEIFG